MTDEFPSSSSSPANSYDPDKVYNASRDSKGFGSSLRMKVPPSLLSELGHVVQSGIITEYRTREDFFRDAIVHRLHWVADRVPSIAPYAAQFTAAAEADSLIALNEHRDDMVKSAAKIVESVRRDKYRNDSAVPVVKGIMDSLPPTSQWHTDVSQLLSELT